MDYKDYYKTLGVSKAASEKEIKSAYRKLARKYHPDVNPGDKAAENRFKEINEAQAVLTDPEKRKKYDALGPDWEKRFRQAPSGGTYTGSPGAGTADFSDFFDTLFGQRGGGKAQPNFDFDLGSIFSGNRGKQATEIGRRGADIEQVIDVDLSEAFHGSSRAFTLQSVQPCPTCHGSGLVNDQLCPTCHGATTVPKTKRLDVKIPAGVREGSRIRVVGEGNPGTNGASAGNLFLIVHLLPDSTFTREGNDLRMTVNVPLTKLVLGGEVHVPALNGRVTMTIPPASQNGRTLRLTGQGMPALKGGGKGDLYVKLSAVLPTALTEEQKTLFEQLEKAGA